MKSPRFSRTFFAAFCLSLTLWIFACGSGVSGHGTPVTSVVATKNPLVANYRVSEYGLAKAWVEFGTDTTYGRETSNVASTTPHGSFEVLVAGMRASTTYHMRAHVEYVDGSSWVDQDHIFRTGPLPSYNHLELAVTRPDPDPGVKQEGVELLDVVSVGTGNLGASVADLDGNIIWYFPGTTFPIKPLPNGHFLVNESFD